MNRKSRHYGILIAGYILITSLVVLTQGSEAAGRFSLLFVPFIFLAGFLEDNVGALSATILSALTVVLGFLFDWIPRATAIVQIMLIGLLFIFVALLIRERDRQQRVYSETRVPEEKELLRMERKAFMIHQQIENYEARVKSLIRTFELAKKLSGNMNLESMLDEARSEVAQALPQHFHLSADTDVRLAFYIPREDTSDFRRVGVRNHEIPDEGFPDEIRAQDLTYWLGETLSPVRIKDLATEVRFEKMLTSTPFHSLMVIPLSIYDIVIGIMALGSSQSGVFSPTDFTQTDLIGKQILFALRKALLYRKVQTLSYTDSQTGLYVHRFFQERLREELHRAERYHQPLSLIMLDMDFFKQVNDLKGHQVGDAVLVEAAGRISEMAGSTALVARYGGEEFAVLLPNTQKIRALQVAEAINCFMKVTTVDVGSLKLPVTVSAGVSCYPEDALSRESLIATADSALYQAKNTGRDKVVAYSVKYASENKNG